MATDRVDKGWSEKGIETYSNAAIFGTLGHYGVTENEASFVEKAKNNFPLEIASEWHKGWKGTGQFTRFPAAAAEELWHRTMQGEFAPTDVGLAIVKLIDDLAKLLNGKEASPELDARFKVVESYAAKLPDAKERRERFIAEMLFALGEQRVAFLDHAVLELTQAKQPAHAERMATVVETLFVERKGIEQAVIQLNTGKREEGQKALLAIANDANRADLSRLLAVNELVAIEAVEPSLPAIHGLLDRAIASRDARFAMELSETLGNVVRVTKDPKERAALNAKVEQLLKVFDEEGAK